MSRKIPQNQGLLYWFTELCVVEVLQSTPKWSFYVNKMNYDLKTYLLNCGNHCRSRKQRACQPITWPNMISIYCAINDKLSRDNFSFIAQQFMKHLNIWREIPYQSAPKYYSLFIEWVQNNRVCHTASIQNPKSYHIERISMRDCDAIAQWSLFIKPCNHRLMTTKKVVNECKAIKLVDRCSRKNFPGLELFNCEKVFCIVVELKWGN